MSILILSGLPGSGKSQYALEWLAEDPNHRTRINYDEIREPLLGTKEWDRTIEKQVKAIARSMAVRAISEGRDLIIDNTNLTLGARAPWEGLGKEFGIPVEQHDINTDIGVCCQRDSKRIGRARVGRAVIERMALTTGWIDWNVGYNPNKFVIVDIDGTLANGDHRKHFVEVEAGAKKDWVSYHDCVHLDTPIQPIFNLVRELAYHYTILIVSGRWIGGGCGKATEDWLDKHWPKCPPEHKYKHLFMRAEGDSRPDNIIKQELLELLPPKDRIAYVIDDRDRVVEMWRANGLTCLQVAPGDF